MDRRDTGKLRQPYKQQQKCCWSEPPGIRKKQLKSISRSVFGQNFLSTEQAEVNSAWCLLRIEMRARSGLGSDKRRISRNQLYASVRPQATNFMTRLSRKLNSFLNKIFKRAKKQQFLKRLTKLTLNIKYLTVNTRIMNAVKNWVDFPTVLPLRQTRTGLHQLVGGSTSCISCLVLIWKNNIKLAETN